MPNKDNDTALTDDAPKRTVSTKIVYENPWIIVREDETATTDGQSGIYGYIESNDSCMVVAVNDKREIYMVHGFRYPSKSYGWELPGGGTDGEDPLDAAQRELKEETGIVASSWQQLGQAYVCNGLLTEKMSVYLAQHLSHTGEKERSDETFSDMRFFSWQEITSLIRDGEINDCQTIACLQYYQIQTQ